jgi:transcriptional regulator with XRE-family HTH domain
MDDRKQLQALGSCLRERRKQLGISALTLAEAAGLSRVTLHRIERGEPSVAVGLVQRAAAALGLGLSLADISPQARPAETPPERLRLDRLPQLQQLAWQRSPSDELSPEEALSLYERNWRHVDTAAMSADERAVLDRLVRTVGGGRLLV